MEKMSVSEFVKTYFENTAPFTPVQLAVLEELSKRKRVTEIYKGRGFRVNKWALYGFKVTDHKPIVPMQAAS